MIDVDKNVMIFWNLDIATVAEVSPMTNYSLCLLTLFVRTKHIFISTSECYKMPQMILNCS